jgi:ribosomal protein S18 acetylase RimI-like enzyme
MQGKGLGRQLLQEVERRLRQRGALKVNLLVERRNVAVMDFYKSLGYETDDVVFMGKLL